MAFALVVVTVIGVVALVLVRTLRPDRQARGLTELCVLLAAYGVVYGPVGAGLVTLNEIDPDLSHLPSFVAGALMGASLAILVVGGIGLAMVLALWVLRRPLELPSKRLGVRWFLLLVVAFAVLFGVAMPVFGTMEDRSAVFAWVFTFLFYTVFWVANSLAVPWLTFLRSPRLAESPEAGHLQSWVDEVMASHGKRPIPVRVHEGSLVNAFVLWGLRKPWLLVGEGLLREMSLPEVRASVFQPGHDHERAGGRGRGGGGCDGEGWWRLGWWGGGGGGARAASPEASGASRGAGGAGHAAGFSALAMSWKSTLRARWTFWPASTVFTACAAASSFSKVTPGFRKPSAPGSDRSFSYGVLTSSWGYFLRRRPFASSTSTAKRQVR